VSYSEEYHKIREEAETTWPWWKISIYNNNFAISTNAKKIKKRACTRQDECKMSN